MAADIFVSFASKDVRVAMTLCGALESRGFTCWISARDIEPGENFQSAIVQALRRAKIMLLVFTANSNASEEMTKELALASQNKMIVIPLRVEDVTPNDAFAYEFATRQWIDVFADWELAIDQLSRRVGQALLDRSSARAGAAADALKTVIASANAKKLADAPRDEDVPPAMAEAARDVAPESERASPPEVAAEPVAEHPVEAAVKVLEALEANADETAAAGPTTAWDAAPAPEAAPSAVDAEIGPASDDDLWPATAAEAAAPPPPPPPQSLAQADADAEAAPARKPPVALLIGIAVAVLAVIGIVVFMLGQGGSKAPSAEPPAPSSAAASSEPASSAAAASSEPVAALPPAAAAAAAAPPAASDQAQSSLEGQAAPKPKRKKAAPKVDIPF